jgi:hypothetical protein
LADIANGMVRPCFSEQVPDSTQSFNGNAEERDGFAVSLSLSQRIGKNGIQERCVVENTDEARMVVRGVRGNARFFCAGIHARFAATMGEGGR